MRSRDRGDEVRLWLARELHDDALQKLTTLLIDMEEARREAPGTAVDDRVLAFQASVRSAIGSLRGLVGEMRRQPCEDHRLVEDVTALVGQLEGRVGIAANLSVSPLWPGRLSTHIASQLRRIVEEALRNVSLHSGARNVSVSLEAEEEQLTLTVSDDGRGCPDSGAIGRGGYGMLGMSERALILGGRLEVSSRPGGGTTVRGTFASPSPVLTPSEPEPWDGRPAPAPAGAAVREPAHAGPLRATRRSSARARPRG